MANWLIASSSLTLCLNALNVAMNLTQSTTMRGTSISTYKPPPVEKDNLHAAKNTGSRSGGEIRMIGAKGVRFESELEL